MFQADRTAAKAKSDAVRVPLRLRVLFWLHWAWRPAGTAVTLTLALALAWHAVHGRHGVLVWLDKMAEERQLHNQIEDLKRDNTRLHQRVDHLKTDPDTIRIEAHDKLHYVKPNEVIVPLPQDGQAQAAAAK
jgi:cell division protein FtsB